MTQLFSGPYFDYVMSQEPLCGADYYAHGSSAMLFQRDGNLYRLTTDGCGHGFLAEQSAKGNSSVVKVIEDFGPMAPSDEYGDWGEYYWLAQVEWLEPVDHSSPDGARLDEILNALAEDGSVVPEERPRFLIECEAAIPAHEEFAPLLATLLQAANYLLDGEGLVDANLSNVMRRPATGALVWADPIHNSIGYMTAEQEDEMKRIREAVRAKAEIA